MKFRISEKSDLHVHSTFTDGANTPEEIVCEAIRRGLRQIGLSDHGHTPCDESYCMSYDCFAHYCDHVRALKEKYRGQIEVLLGVEQDLYTDTPTEGLDYAIGSVHYMRFGDEYVVVDENPDVLRDAAVRFCAGDIYGVVRRYFETVAEFAAREDVDIVGHFDLIRKFNRGGALFDESDPRYIDPMREALDKLIASGKIFEVNTGAISRGYQDEPYPAPAWIPYIRAHGNRLVLTSDAHTKETLCYAFEQWRPLLEKTV